MVYLINRDGRRSQAGLVAPFAATDQPGHRIEREWIRAVPRQAPPREAREEHEGSMKAPIALPFIKKGEDVPPSGVTVQAVLGFLLPFFLIALAGIIIFFMINAR